MKATEESIETEQRMGKRGPKPGATYRKGIDFTGRLRIQTDKQLVAAQHFNDRLDRLMADIDGHVYPTAQIDGRAVRQLLRDMERVQNTIIGAIEEYLNRPASWRGDGGSAIPAGRQAQNETDDDDDTGLEFDESEEEPEDAAEPPMPARRDGLRAAAPPTRAAAAGPPRA